MPHRQILDKFLKEIAQNYLLFAICLAKISSE